MIDMWIMVKPHFLGINISPKVLDLDDLEIHLTP